MTSYLKPLVASLVLISSSFANANNEDVLPTRASDNSLYHVYIGALYNQPDNKRATDYGYGAIAAVGIPLTSISNRLYLELGASHTILRSDRSLPTEFFRKSFNADIQYAFGNRDQLTPFLLAGIGVARNDVIPDNFDKTTFTANIGAGLTGLLIGDSVRGRIDIRGVYDDYLDNVFDGIITAGIEIPLGRARAETVERIVTVEKQVEVIKEVVREVVPIDSDGDGIPDSIDECPDTLPGVRTDNRGCAIGQTLTIENIEFDFNKATLTANSNSILDAATKFLNSQDNLRIVIAGHTDNVGSAAYNQRLSEARARSVMQALIARGIAANRLKTIGLGDSFPRAENVTQEGRDRNRRVEFLLSAADRPARVNTQQPSADTVHTTN